MAEGNSKNNGKPKYKDKDNWNNSKTRYKIFMRSGIKSLYYNGKYQKPSGIKSKGL